ncbi:MAG: SDR family NAD(P)-dependent oxidoreductase [Chloroflexota bacterium]
MENKKRLSGQVAIVTGSSKGIGRGIAGRLAQEGARVVINSRHAEEAEKAAQAMRAAGCEALAVAADVGRRDDVERLFAEARRAFGTVDILVNNAAVANPVSHFLQMDEEHWDGVMRVNLKSVYLCSHQAANLLVDQHKAGCIVNISSFGAARSHRQMAAYDATKGAIEAFTRTVALDLAPFRIRVNAIGPGAIHATEHLGEPEAATARRASVVPLGRVGQPADIAGVVAFLASADASYITGQVLYVDGGMLAQLRCPQMDSQLPPEVAARLWG